MTVDLEAIARRTNCELTSLRSALPLLEQGYAPPFLARYRRDELGGLSEHSMWMLYRAIREEAWIRNRREDLIQRLEQMPQADPALGRAIRSASSKRVIDRLARRLRGESGEAGSPATRVASRILSPEKGDPNNVPALVDLMGLQSDTAAIDAGLDAALVARLAGHPQIQSAAVRWLFNNAKIRILSVKDTHMESAAGDAADNHDGGESLSGDGAAAPTAASPRPGLSLEQAPGKEPGESWPTPEQLTAVPASADSTPQEVAPAESTSQELASPEETSQEQTAQEETASEASTQEGTPTEQASLPPSETAVTVADDPAPEVANATTVVGDVVVSEDATAENPTAEPTGDDPAQPAAEASTEAPKSNKPRAKKGKGKPQAKPKETKPAKKISPRQRRRRWLVSVLQPLAGKEILAQRLTAFQTLMIGRGLRSGVVQCQFVYDTNVLTEQLQRAAAGLNEAFADKLRDLVGANDSVIRESAEAAWWDELLESSATRLVGVAADHLDAQINRHGVDAKIVLSVDAMGPRTAALAIVAADGRLIHTEDIPCQLTAAMRTAAVTRLGELIHQYGVDLIVISNGPARRACLVILHELVEQSTAGSVRWTVAERSGADVYAGSEIGNREMRSTPRRFRSAAWLAFSVLRPSQAMTKVDPLRLRLGSFQRELSEDALWPALRDVMTSGVSRGGVDVNSAPVDWLCQLPGFNREVAVAIDKRRRSSLFTSRAEIAEMEQWSDPASLRQAIPFLRVFGSSETLDGTLIHPDDYVLAKKLATALKLDLPPATPPGYQPPNFEEPAPSAAAHELMAQVSRVEEVKVIISEAAENFAAELLPADAAEASETEVEQLEAMVEPVAEEAPATEVAESEATTAAEPEATAVPSAEAEKVVQPVEVLAPIRQPKPDEALIKKCIKEWQVGARRVRQIVNALCDPFGDEDSSGNGEANAVMTKVPKLADLAIGDRVIGVVVGVTEFGAFIEMSPECSGLIHVSRVADHFVEDLHEAVQVGDVITAWVTNIDAKRRRVGLSAISPEREAEMERQRQERRDESRNYGGRPQRGGDQNRGEQNRGGQNRGDNRGSAPRSDNRGAPNRTAQPAGAAQAAGGQANAGQRGGGAPRGDSRGGDQRGGDNRGRSDSRGGGGAPRGDSRGGQRGGQRGGRRDRDDRDDGPTSYSTRVTRSDVPAAPITDAMAKGDEPLRSFGDLMQFFKKAAPEPVVKPKVVKPIAEPTESTGSIATETESAAKPAQSDAAPTESASSNAAAPSDDGATPES